MATLSHTNEQLRDYVLSRLETITPLPLTGYIAGGAVGNLIWECVSGVTAVINDVDVFCVAGVKPIDLNDYFFQQFTIAEINRNVYEKNHYNQVIYRESGGDYVRVTNSERLDMINTVKYETNNSDLNVLLKSFDINAVMCGIDMATKELVMRDEFVQFLATKKLKIINFNTPGHSAVRILCKRDDLQVSYDLSSQIESIRLVLSNHMPYTRVCFGQKYYQLYERHAKTLNGYFHLDEITGKRTHQLWKFSMRKTVVNYSRGYTKHNVTLYNYYANHIKDNPLLLQLWRFFELPWHIYETKHHKPFLEGLSVAVLHTPDMQRQIKQAAKIIKYNNAHLYGERPLVDTLLQIKWLDEIIQEKKDPLYRIAYSQQDEMLYADTKEELSDRLTILRIKKRHAVQQAKDASARKAKSRATTDFDMT